MKFISTVAGPGYLTSVSKATEWDILFNTRNNFIFPSIHVLFCFLYKKKSKGHVTRGNFPCNLQCNGVALQVARKTPSCDIPCLQLVSQRKIALQVAEKVEAASTVRNATRQVAACDTPTATCLAIFFEKEPITIRHNQNATDIFKYLAGVKYNLIADRKTSCVRLTS